MKKFQHVGRLLFGLALIAFGVMHVMMPDQLGKLILGGIPAASILVIVSGIGLGLAGLAFVLNKYVKQAALLLALEITIITFVVEIPRMINSSEGTAHSVLFQLLMNIMLIGFCLFIAEARDNEELQIT